LDDNSTGPYQGYKGDLEPEVVITGQDFNIPGSETIDVKKRSGKYLRIAAEVLKVHLHLIFLHYLTPSIHTEIRN